jgi:phosphoribosylanthranilate isomerase
MTVVKVCGVTSPEDAHAAVAAGVDWIGINLVRTSRRYVDGGAARRIADAARAAGEVTIVGVFVDELIDIVDRAVSDLGLDLCQFHGDETPGYCTSFDPRRHIKALPLTASVVEETARYACSVVLLDTPTPGRGGSGKVGNWALARDVARSGRRVLLAGGLTVDNVGEAVRTVRPYGVDVASGVEAAVGKKDPDKLVRFVAAAKAASSNGAGRGARP